MRTKYRLAIRAAVLAVALAGCGSNGTSSVDPPAQPAANTTKHAGFGNPSAGLNHTVRDGGAFDAGPVMQGSGATGTVVSEFLADAGDNWSSLIEAQWTLPADSEAYLCVRVTAPRDVYLHEFSPLVPTGTHHNTLSVHAAGEAPDGVVECGSEVSGHNIFGAGVGTKDLTLPDGVAMQIHKGEQLLLNLHLFNSDSNMLEGKSGVRVRTIDAADVKNVAEIVLGGPLNLSIPPGGPTTQSGQCTFDREATIFSVGPHMHQLGVHARISAHRAVGGDVMLYDGPYSFESQQRYPVDLLKVQPGDAVHIDCTYQNDTDHSVSFGTSTLDEMCFASIMRYPAGTAGSYLCTN